MKKVFLFIASLFVLTCLFAKESSSSPAASESNFEIHEVEFALDFKNSGYSIKLYKEPDVKSKEVYTIKKGDKLNVSQYLIPKKRGDIFIKAKAGKKEGYIKVQTNPYNKGTFSPKETIKVGDDEVQILVFTGHFGLNEGTVLKSLPSEASKDVYTLTKAEGKKYYKVDGITQDYKWLKVTVNGKSGWVTSESLYQDRGGPIIFTPENSAQFDLIYANEI